MNHLFFSPNLGIKQILVVDDASDISSLLVTVLELEGYQVDTATCGYIAIAKIEANPPSLVLLDLIMPGLDGYEVARWIRQNQPSVPIMIITAAEELPAFDLQQVRINGLIRKPFSLEELVSQVKSIVETKQDVCL